jgi:hypothetical protein
MADYSPTPWRVEVWDYLHANPPRKELNIQSDTLLLATLSWDWRNDNPYVVDSETAYANAYLMAAAPDLLEALEYALEFLTANDDGEADLLEALEYALEFLTANDDGEADVSNRIASAKAAIAKARNIPAPERPLPCS